ncbi:MAG: hypothetical protein QXO00_04140 [Candidatus Bathyarchaeia archaeon]
MSGERFICPNCGQRLVEVIRHNNAWEYSNDFESLGKASARNR